MRIGGCSRESELAALLASGHWPGAADSELRAHVASCRTCGDLALIRDAFSAERALASAQPRLQSPGAICWRAQLRRRNAVLRRINRPLLGAQIFAVAVTIVGAFGLMAAYLPRPQGWSPAAITMWIAQLPHALHLDALWPEAHGADHSSAWLVVPILASVALMSGVVAFLASDRR